MKKKKLLILILIFFFILTLLIWSTPLFSAADEPNDKVVSDLLKKEGANPENVGLSEPKILATSPFYFLKNWFWDFRQKLTIDPLKKIEIDLKIVSQKLFELRKLAEKNPNNVQVLEKALKNYEEARAQLKSRLNNLQGQSQNPNISRLLDEITDAALQHEKLFGDIISKNTPPDFKNKIEGIVGEGMELVLSVSNRLETKEELIKRLENRIKNEKGGIFKNLRTLEILEKLSNQLTDLPKEKLEALREDLYSQVQRDLTEAGGILQDKLPLVMRFLPGHKLAQENIMRILQERSGQTEFFEKIRNEMKKAPVSINSLNDCKNNLTEVEKQIAEFKNQIKDSKNLPANLESLVEQADGHLKRAKEIFDLKEDARTVCGLIQSAAALIENAERLFFNGQPEKIEVQLQAIEEKLKNLKEKINHYNPEDYPRIFDIFNEIRQQVDSIKANKQAGNYEQVLRGFNNLASSIKNLDEAFEIIESPKNISENVSLKIKKDFLQKEKSEAFKKWCSEEKGILVGDAGVLPSCFINDSYTSMFEWLKESPFKN